MKKISKGILVGGILVGGLSLGSFLIGKAYGIGKTNEMYQNTLIPYINEILTYINKTNEN